MCLGCVKLGVPCNITWYGVDALGWCPWDMAPASIDNLSGLLAIYKELMDFWRIKRRQITLVLCDVDWFGCLLGLAYSIHYVWMVVHTRRHGKPFLFWLWLGYKNCVNQV